MKNHADVRAQALFCNGAQIAPVEGYRAACGIVESRHETQQSALARSRAAHKGHGLAGLNGEIDVLQNTAFLRVAKAHPCKLDASPHLF